MRVGPIKICDFSQSITLSAGAQALRLKNGKTQPDEGKDKLTKAISCPTKGTTSEQGACRDYAMTRVSHIAKKATDLPPGEECSKAPAWQGYARFPCNRDSRRSGKRRSIPPSPCLVRVPRLVVIFKSGISLLRGNTTTHSLSIVQPRTETLRKR